MFGTVFSLKINTSLLNQEFGGKHTWLFILFLYFIFTSNTLFHSSFYKTARMCHIFIWIIIIVHNNTYCSNYNSLGWVLTLRRKVTVEWRIFKIVFIPNEKNNLRTRLSFSTNAFVVQFFPFWDICCVRNCFILKRRGSNMSVC